jgi:hypothetical protein
MNITKKQWMIIGVVVALIAIWYFFLRKKKAESSFGARTGRVGASAGTGIVNVANPKKICCCKADIMTSGPNKGYCNNPSSACCSETVGNPKPLPGGVA